MLNRISIAALLTLAAFLPAKGQSALACVEAVVPKIERNWVLPAAAKFAPSDAVRLRIELKRDGFLMRPPVVTNPANSPLQQTLADAAIRAAEKGQPYSIPPGLYEQCRILNLRFDPRFMNGG